MSELYYQAIRALTKADETCKCDCECECTCDDETCECTCECDCEEEVCDCDCDCVCEGETCKQEDRGEKIRLATIVKLPNAKAEEEESQKISLGFIKRTLVL
jgi:hypothetical protein